MRARFQSTHPLGLESVALFDVVRFMEALAETRSPSTVNKYRRYLLAIVRVPQAADVLPRPALPNIDPQMQLF